MTKIVLMLDLLLVAIGIAGFGIAGYLDLKTTEFPDYIPYAMIGAALAARGAFSFLGNDYSILTDSVIIGGIFLALGLALYHAKQWGDGDAWLLGAMGFLFPDSTGFAVSGLLPFPLVLMFNFFLVAFVYLIVYSLALGFRHKIFGQFFAYLKTKATQIKIIFIGCFALFAFISSLLFITPLTGTAFLGFFPALLFFMSVFAYYGHFIEKKVFRKKISVSRLRVGDVPVGMRWKVITKKELSVLKKKGGTVWIKEGVRFSPAFLITLLATLLFGSLFI